MPSASAKSSQPSAQVCDLMQEPLKNAVQVLEKKLRNLDKRKMKLVETRKKAESGDNLNDDQKKAIEALELVENSVVTVKELHKNMVSLEQEYNRQIKKEQKRAKQEHKEQSESQNHDLALKVVEVQGVLGELSEEVRPDFLEGANGACKLTEDELANLDSFYELVNLASAESDEKKMSVRCKVAGEHLINLVLGKDTPVVEDLTYKTLNEIVNKILSSGYFNKDDSEDQTVPQESEESVEELETATEVEPVEVESPEEEFPDTEFTQPDTVESPVNGVDLPPEVQQTPDDEKIDFMGESEIVTGSPDQQAPSLNPVSPEFVPRNQQQSPDDTSGWENGPPETTPAFNDQTNSDGWQSVPDQGNHQGGGFRGRGGGRGGRGFGGRGRGRGGSGGNYRGGRQDGGSYRGGSRGGRGGSRGGQRGRGGGNRGGGFGAGSGSGGFGKPTQQQQQ